MGNPETFYAKVLDVDGVGISAEVRLMDRVYEIRRFPRSVEFFNTIEEEDYFSLTVTTTFNSILWEYEKVEELDEWFNIDWFADWADEDLEFLNNKL